MKVIHGRSVTGLGGAGMLIASCCGVAVAGDGPAPELQIGWTVDGNSDSGTLTGSGLGAGRYSYTATSRGDNYEINWSLLVTDNGSNGGFEILATTLGITNTGDLDAIFELDVSLPVDLGPGNAFYGGGFAGALTGGEFGGYLSTVSGSTAMWTAMVDGGFLGSLGAAPFELETVAYESADLAPETFGDPIPGLEFAAARESMSIHIDFVLGARSTFAITSNYVAQVPTPATLALFAFVGAARRHRRD
jgi:hypothetical protein